MPKTLNLDTMNIIAKQKGGTCLSPVYIDSGTKLLWCCNQGHQWLATPGSVRNLGTWCPVCANNKPLNIEQMNMLATARGGRCLSKHYENSKTKLEWQCVKGHKWKATPFSIKIRKSWCPLCVRGGQHINGNY